MAQGKIVVSVLETLAPVKVVKIGVVESVMELPYLPKGYVVEVASSAEWERRLVWRVPWDDSVLGQLRRVEVDKSVPWDHTLLL
mmetsp:Transcript_44248/g.69200  ORF Transcript_44248/g.69200 Transcript_44248/m.69200 type:complete len:84 (-) Transcript_44248:81-332(-)